MGTYAQATYSLTDQLKLTGGVRYTSDDVRTDAVIANYAADGTTLRFCNELTATFPQCDVHYRLESDEPTWLIGLDYHPIDDVLLYAKYARGYRAGGIAPQAPSEFAIFEPEEVDTYEVGTKTSFAGALTGTLNVALFYNDFSNQQLQLQLLPKPGSLVAPASAILNAGASTIYGAEIDASFMLFTGFTLDIGYAYLNTELDEVTPVTTSAASPYNVVSPVRVGDELTHTPRNKYSATATYVLPIDDSIGEISLGATFTHSDEAVLQLQQEHTDTRGSRVWHLGGKEYPQPQCELVVYCRQFGRPCDFRDQRHERRILRPYTRPVCISRF